MFKFILMYKSYCEMCQILRKHEVISKQKQISLTNCITLEWSCKILDFVNSIYIMNDLLNFTKQANIVFVAWFYKLRASGFLSTQFP